MADQVTIIIDDQNFAALAVLVDTIRTAGLSNPGFYNGSLFVPQGLNANWTWTLEFDGTSVSLVGCTPPSQYNQTIGLADPTNDTNSITQPQRYRPYTYPPMVSGFSGFGGPFYTSGTLPTPGQMVLGLSNANGLAIDYALVTAGDSTNLQGQTIIVDDASPEIFWNGNWVAHDNLTVSVQCSIPGLDIFKQGTPVGNPDHTAGFFVDMPSHANTTHQSSNVGDSFTFQFAGTSLLISGITPGVGDNWLLHMEFTLDGNTTTNVFTPGEDSTVRLNVVYFDATFDTTAENHTLVAKVLSVAGSPLPAARIDYITYRPSFVTIADKPSFPPPPASIAIGAQPSTSSATGAASSGTATVPAMLGAPVKHRTSVGVIVGGVMGGCLLIALFSCTFYLWRRRRTREKDQFAPEPFDSSATSDMRERSQRSKREPLSVDANALAERRNDLAAEIQHLQESRHGEEDEQTVEERLQVLQAQMNTLTHHLVPPSYAET
ncbi:hypothetical protein DFH06DRAFT_1125145 [Mycena polygramma]|nr:hypothetical protein DFH06DRAFT_1125145 [Mycena polygramma]